MPSALSLLQDIKQPRLMGILNVTPDSFSDGGMYLDPDLAIQQGILMIESGAAIIDLGGESTRPSSSETDAQEEQKRVIPVLRELIQRYPHITYSIDTRHAATAAAAIELGASIVNDISALQHDPQMAALLAKHPRVQVILMHMQGQPQTMQDAPFYTDLLGEIKDFFAARIAFCTDAGIDPSRLILDVGIGFGKTAQHNLQLLAQLDTFTELGMPLVLGASRKSFIDQYSPSGVQDRLAGSLAAALVSALQDVEILRVHDVAEHRQFFALLNAITGASL
ncbi:MAG: dihydropteroate synthase [Candidatus Cloacimonetes bacterium]|nr:dihydropteroate synthase [Candidatus Cloacimonadota bacterium]NLO10843.1 dihydropteroate synthase [Candidatus Cloacimonadota bacterium]